MGTHLMEASDDTPAQDHLQPSDRQAIIGDITLQARQYVDDVMPHLERFVAERVDEALAARPALPTQPVIPAVGLFNRPSSLPSLSVGEAAPHLRTLEEHTDVHMESGDTVMEAPTATANDIDRGTPPPDRPPSLTNATTLAGLRQEPHASSACALYPVPTRLTARRLVDSLDATQRWVFDYNEAPLESLERVQERFDSVTRSSALQPSSSSTPNRIMTPRAVVGERAREMSLDHKVRALFFYLHTQLGGGKGSTGSKAKTAIAFGIPETQVVGWIKDPRTWRRVVSSLSGVTYQQVRPYLTPGSQRIFDIDCTREKVSQLPYSRTRPRTCVRVCTRARAHAHAHIHTRAHAL
eukprot:GHVU01143100.1.p1 GENE.GHVU01143100.1~~GHVU01143100.1.p1  ORF type:complete len:353 (-),score=28.89 GHVU01143100.1:91-1149(-)